MLKSMTGFGKATGSNHGKKIVVELRALNSKSLDLYLKLPSYFKEKEIELRKIITQELDRGKVEAIVTVENIGEQGTYAINRNLAKAYYSEIKSLAEEVGAENDQLFSNIFRLPDILVQQNNELAEEDWNYLKELLLEAIQHLNAFRAQEGESLKNDFNTCISKIETALEDVVQYEQERIEVVRERMTKGLEELSQKVDENRLEQELIFYIEKLDVSEEKVRLKNHLSYFKDTMNSEDGVGKKLGFIAQEMGREINTLGSKANHAEIQKLVVEMKDNLERIKEQVLNTL
jgi:uncharacterized protein (TIGR00255 family)